MSPRRNRPARAAALVAACNTRQLHYNAAAREFTVEASAFGWTPGDYADRVMVTSERTGREIEMLLVAVNVDSEGDTLSWRYESNPPGVGPLALVVYND